MLRAHTVANVRDAEDRAMRRIGPDALMQRAAEGLAGSLDDVPSGARVLMLIGPGNNGGDALFAATHLLRRGVYVDLCALDADKVHPAGWEAAVAAGAHAVDEPGDQPWVVDALFGIGARSALRGRAAELAARVASAHIISVDVPSGIDVDGGTLPGPAVRASRTVTFGTYKPGLLVSPAAEYAGSDVAELVDIGLDDHLGTPEFEALEPSDGAELAQHLFTASSVDKYSVHKYSVHKYSRGVIGVAAGSEQFAGAAHLTVSGALAGPAGMVRFLGDEQLVRRVVDRAPEVVASPERSQLSRVQAWAVGPGAGSDAENVLRTALGDRVPTVIDADALACLPGTLDAPAVLTPHSGELARMLGIRRDDVDADTLTHGRAAAEQWNATVLLKGRRTCVFTPGEPVRVNLSGTPWLGTAGSGDVLSGLIGSMLATGMPPHEAASISAYLHGAAAVHANPGGPVVASQVASAIPNVTAAFLDGRLDRVRRW